MNSLKRHKQANKTKDTIIMTKYNIVKIFRRRLLPEKPGIRAMLFPCVCGQKIPGSVWPTGQRAGRMPQVLRRGCIAQPGSISVYLYYKRG